MIPNSELGIFDETKLSLVLLNTNKISMLSNSEISFSLTVPSYKKLTIKSQFDLTRFYDVTNRDYLFLTWFSNSGIPGLLE